MTNQPMCWCEIVYGKRHVASGCPTHDPADASVRGKPECLCHCGADAIGTDNEGRWACGRHIETPAKSWDDATSDEIRDARIQSLEEGLQRLKDCTCSALEQTAQRDGSPVRPESLLDEEWSK